MSVVDSPVEMRGIGVRFPICPLKMFHVEQLLQWVDYQSVVYNFSCGKNVGKKKMGLIYHFRYPYASSCIFHTI